MKKLSILIISIFTVLTGFSQVKTTQKEHPIKTDDQYLPRWSLDLNYKLGTLNQNISLYDFGQFYNQSITGSNNFSSIKFSEGQSNGICAGIGYFFGENRNWGIGTGLSFYIQKGVMTMDNFQTQYKSLDNNNDTFRQILSNKGVISESVTMYNLTMPFLLKYKHQWNGTKWGIAVDAGPFLGLSNTNSTSGKATFNYEAAYKYNGQTAVYDNGITLDPNDEIVTRAFWTSHPTTDGTVEDYFSRKYSEGMNVALDKQLDKNASTSYNTLSYGFTINPSLTYQLSYNSSLMFGMYYNQQYFRNKNVNNYMLTDKVGEYNSLTNGIKTNVVNSWGVSIGIRILFGEQADRDNDHVADELDKCPLIWGQVKNFGCLDSDGDGVIDDKDECKDVRGSIVTHGCPDKDGDGFADKDDKCPDVPGEYSGCPVNLLAEKNGYSKGVIAPEPKDPYESYYDVLETNTINFKSNKANVIAADSIVLQRVVEMLNNNEKVIVLVSGHTDAIGTYTPNMKLSFARANTVKKYLLNKGINPDRVIIAGYGKENPIVDNKTADHRAKNRRIELKLMIPLPKKQ